MLRFVLLIYILIAVRAENSQKCQSIFDLHLVAPLNSTNNWLILGQYVSFYNSTALQGINAFKRFYLINQNVPRLCANTFTHENLEFLDFTRNHIRTIEPYAFNSLPKLNKLKLSENKIFIVPNEVFNNMKGLQSLSLDNNEIAIIESCAFDNMPKLEYIYLNNNKLKEYSPAWFKQAASLRYVNMQSNLITEIPKGAFRNFNGSQVDQISIFFDNNGITSIHQTAFASIKRLGTLSLEGNPLKTFNAECFQSIVFGELLNLRQTELLPTKRIMESLSRFRYINLKYNPQIGCKLVTSVRNWNQNSIISLDDDNCI